MEDNQKKSLGNLGAWLGVGGNTLLIALKLAAGIVGKSQGLIAEAIHSGADLLSSLGVLVGMKISHKPADADHPFGHGKAQSIAAIAVSVVLFLTGVELAITGVEGIMRGTETVPSPLTLYIAIFTVVYNEVLFRYRLNIGKKINSPAIISDAWHQRADVFACVAVTVGIIGARMGFPIADPAAAAVVSVFIMKAGWDLVVEALKQLMDASADDEVNKEIEEALISFEQIKEIEAIRTRCMGPDIIVDLKYRVDPSVSVEEAHELSIKVKMALIAKNSNIKDVSVHYGPVQTAAAENDGKKHLHQKVSA